jgi:hypothetical protein
MSIKVYKTCSPLCPHCRDLSLEVHIADSIEMDYYRYINYIPSGVLSFVHNGYVHNILKSKVDNKPVENTINLLNDTVYSEYAFDMYEDMSVVPDVIALSSKNGS